MMAHEKRKELVADIVAWIRGVAESEPDDPKAPVYREIATDIEKRWETGEFSTEKLCPGDIDKTGDPGSHVDEILAEHIAEHIRAGSAVTTKQGKAMTTAMLRIQIKEPDQLQELAHELGLSDELRDRYILWCEVATLDLIVDERLIIVGGRFLDVSR
jgi:hypothetical protein